MIVKKMHMKKIVVDMHSFLVASEELIKPGDYCLAKSL